MKYVMIFAIMLTVVSCKQNPAESAEHKELVTAHATMEAAHEAMTSEHNEMTDNHEKMIAAHSGVENDSLHVDMEKTHGALLSKHQKLIDEHKALLEKHNIETSINIIEPASYLTMLWLLDNCEMVITDSGGVQKEAYFFNKNCLTVRDQTEWVELIDLGVNMLTPATDIDIRKNFNLLSEKKFLSEKDLYGGGDASRKIVEDIIARLAEVNGE